MCLAIPGKILSLDGDLALADFNGKKKRVSLKFVKAKKDDYVICAGDVVTDVIPKTRALKMLEFFNGNKR